MNKEELQKFKETLIEKGYDDFGIYGGTYPSKSIYDDNAIGSALRVSFKEIELVENELYSFGIRIEVNRDFADSIILQDSFSKYNSIEEVETVAKSFFKWCCQNVPMKTPTWNGKHG